MDIKKLITTIYSSTINIVLDGISDEYKKEIIKEYQNYLVQNYKKYANSSYSLEDLIAAFTNLEQSRWKRKNPAQKMTELLKDEALDGINKLSIEGRKYATERINNVAPGNKQDSAAPTIDVESANKYIESLNSYLPMVRIFNQTLAKVLISECNLDFLYASGQTSDMSLGTGRLYK